MNPCSAVWSELAKLCQPLLYPTRTVKHIPDFLSTSFYAWCFLLPIMVKNKITHAYRIEMIKIVHLTSTLWVNPILIYIHTFLHTDDAQADTCLPSPRVPVHIQFTTFHMACSYLLVLNSEQIVPHTIIMSITSLMTLWKGVFEVDQKEVIGLCIWRGLCVVCNKSSLYGQKQLSGTLSHKVNTSWGHNNSILHYWACLYYTYNYV